MVLGRSCGVATRWLCVAIVGVSLGLACSQRGRGFCGRYAEAVEDCCPDQEYAHLKVICDQDLRTAYSISSGCAQATREVYYCAEAHACLDACAGVDPCTQEQQAMLGICAESPPPPEL